MGKASFLSTDHTLQEDAEYAVGKQLEGKGVKKFIPFGDGARSCVGRTLAQLNLTTALAQLYGHFTFRLADEVGAPSH